MKLPNSYGGVIRLAGRRRKKYAVRVSAGYKQRICVPNKKEYFPIIEKYGMEFRKGKNDYVMYGDDDSVLEQLNAAHCTYRLEFVRKYKYLEYFDRSKDAYDYLAKYNRGEEIKEHTSRTSEPSFKDVYDAYIEFAKSLRKPPSEATLRSYKTGFNNWSDLHDLRFKCITTKQLQKCLTAHGDLSKGAVGRMLTILKRMYKFALANQLCDKDLSVFLFAEHTDERKFIHSTFTDDEINLLWKHSDEDAASVILILIYTGLRCSEFLQLKTENIHLDERYMIGGLKTDAGRNRIVPIHKSILPLLKRLYEPHSVFLYPNKKGRCYEYQRFRDLKWKVWMERYGMNHFTHDARHTCATKLEDCGVSAFHRKLILGHAVRDITDGTYTHVSHKTLIEDIDKWPE